MTVKNVVSLSKYNTCIFCRWTLPTPPYESGFAEIVAKSSLPDAARFSYSIGEWSSNLVGLTSSLLVNANYDSHAGHVECSVMNIAVFC